MKSIRGIIWVLSSTLALLAGLLLVAPFRLLTRGMDWLYGAPPEWTQVTTLVQDDRVHEVSSGDHPLASLAKLERQWAEHPHRPRVVLIGNSQMQTITLAPGEPPPSRGEKTYFDHLADALGVPPTSALLYRLSAGGLSYPEALWYTQYLMSMPGLRPDVLVLQINYQSFWQGGIRESMYELLATEPFRLAIRQLAGQRHPYSDTLEEALARFAKGSASEQAAGRASGAAQTSAGSSAFGPTVEARFREAMEGSSVFRRRHDEKRHLMEFLYRFRVYVLGLKPSNARSITGTRLVRSRAALETIVDLCREHNVRLILFLAPLNPEVNLFRTPADGQGYHDFAEALAARANVPLLDLESKIPAEFWGRYLNSPDPLHLGRKGHQRMAALLLPFVRESLPAQ
jgi:hypothetical protein